MPYQMTIGCDINGAPLIGARACREQNAVDVDHIFPSQLAYRVTACDCTLGSAMVCTRTYAKENGLEILATFPAADGSLSAR